MGIEIRVVVGLLFVIAQVPAWLSKMCRGICVWGGRERLGAETGADRSGNFPPGGMLYWCGEPTGCSVRENDKGRGQSKSSRSEVRARMAPGTWGGYRSAKYEGGWVSLVSGHQVPSLGPRRGIRQQ